MKSDSNTEPEKKPAGEVDSGGCAPMPGSRAVERVWIVEREDGSLVVDPADGRAWPYVKMTTEIIEALTNAGILKTP